MMQRIGGLHKSLVHQPGLSRTAKYKQGRGVRRTRHSHSVKIGLLKANLPHGCQRAVIYSCISGGRKSHISDGKSINNSHGCLRPFSSSSAAPSLSRLQTLSSSLDSES